MDFAKLTSVYPNGQKMAFSSEHNHPADFLPFFRFFLLSMLKHVVGAVVFCANLHRLMRFSPAIFFSKKTHRTCRKSTPLFASKPLGSNFPGHGHPFSHTKTKKFTWEVVPARGPNRGATPSGTSTNSLYRAVLSRRSHRVIMRRFAISVFYLNKVS